MFKYCTEVMEVMKFYNFFKLIFFKSADEKNPEQNLFEQKILFRVSVTIGATG